KNLFELFIYGALILYSNLVKNSSFRKQFLFFSSVCFWQADLFQRAGLAPIQSQLCVLQASINISL
ncbi:MAG: hypothetical protein OXJ52_01825, partial [Oligoflexia bacterium]|nr:hypothetical protein [Oligoflexia bacterium]